MNLALITGLLLACIGMLSLCLGLERNYKQLGQPAPPKAVLTLLRGAGWLALVGSLVFNVMAWGWAMGPVGCLGMLSVAGLSLVFLLPYAKDVSAWVKRLCTIATGSALK